MTCGQVNIPPWHASRNLEGQPGEFTSRELEPFSFALHSVICAYYPLEVKIWILRIKHGRLRIKTCRLSVK